MTSKFNNFEHDDLATGSEEKAQQVPDYFELLSAYIDGELSTVEKAQVQHWLDHDPNIKRLYTQLLALQENMQHSVAPPSNRSVAEITTEVFRSVDDRRRRRKLVWSGAIAASILATLSGLIPSLNSQLRTASKQAPLNESSAVMLAVAVNKPAINIPKPINGEEVQLPTTKHKTID